MYLFINNTETDMNNVLLNNVNFSCHLQVNVVDSKWYFKTIKKNTQWQHYK